jgi:hypothetical protein
MAGTIFQAFDTPANMTITLNGLTNGATRYSTSVSSIGGATLFLDALITASDGGTSFPQHWQPLLRLLKSNSMSA